VLPAVGWSSSLTKTLNSIGWNACALALQGPGCGIQAEDQNKGIRLAIVALNLKQARVLDILHLRSLTHPSDHSCRFDRPTQSPFHCSSSQMGTKLYFLSLSYVRKLHLTACSLLYGAILLLPFWQTSVGSIKLLGRCDKNHVPQKLSLLC